MYMKRHIGRITNTDRRCLVVFMQIPGKEDHALIIDTDSLPLKFHDELMEVVDREGQNYVNLADILSRRLFAYTGVDMLSTLHQNGLMHAVPIQNIVMVPRPNITMPLSEIIKATNIPAHEGNKPTNKAPIMYDSNQTNRIIENQRIDNEEKQIGIARSLLIEASLLEEDALAKREKAYSLAPSLRPHPVHMSNNPQIENSEPNTLIESNDPIEEIIVTTDDTPKKKSKKNNESQD